MSSKRLVPRSCKRCCTIPCSCVKKILSELKRYGFVYGAFDCNDKGDFVLYKEVEEMINKIMEERDEG